jgi:uncharacterized membrane protein
MSDLFAIAYNDLGSALQVRRKLFELQKERLIDLEDALVVERRQDGSIKLHQINSPAAGGAVGGALWGGLIGMIFLVPFLGALVGGATGAAVGSMADYGVDDDFARRLGEELRPGAAALLLLVRSATPDKVIPVIAPLGGTLFKSSLSAEAEGHLREAAQSARATATATETATAGAGAGAGAANGASAGA